MERNCWLNILTKKEKEVEKNDVIMLLKLRNLIQGNNDAELYILLD